MEGVREPVHDVADDDARPVHRHHVEEVGAGRLALRDDLAPLIVVARGLPDVEFPLEHGARPQAADVGARDVMQPADARVATEGEHVPRASHVARVGLAVGLPPAEHEAGRGVHDLPDVGGDPATLLRREAEALGRQISLEHHRTGHVGPGHLLPVAEQFVHAACRVARLRAAHDHRHAVALGRQIANERPAQEARGPGQENVGIGAGGA